MVRRHLKHCDVIQVKYRSGLPEAISKYHPSAVVINTKPGEQALDDAVMGESAVPTIECSLPSPAWLVQDLAIAGYLSKPMTARGLLEKIESIGDVKDVLIVDDDRGFTLLVQRMLQASGKTFEVRRAYDGVQALAALHERIPDLVLADVIMPELDGIGLLTHMKSEPNLAAIPVILITSNDESSEPNIASRIVVQHRNGLYPIEVLNCLNAISTSLKRR